MKELQPVNQQVLLEFAKKEEKTQSGIFIPDSAQEKPKFGKVIAISGIENSEIAVGDQVFYKEYSGTEITFEGNDYLLVPYGDIMAKVVETDSI
ncbi:MAG: co-chaperone GroES [Bacteroidetes bacterium]|nr:co-chaperone GroES [Bacteroidota bacterium]